MNSNCFDCVIEFDELFLVKEERLVITFLVRCSCYLDISFNDVGVDITILFRSGCNCIIPVHIFEKSYNDVGVDIIVI